MFKDDEKIVIKRILDDKDKQFLDFTYTGDTKKIIKLHTVEVIKNLTLNINQEFITI